MSYLVQIITHEDEGYVCRGRIVPMRYATRYQHPSQAHRAAFRLKKTKPDIKTANVIEVRK